MDSRDVLATTSGSVDRKIFDKTAFGTTSRVAKVTCKLDLKGMATSAQKTIWFSASCPDIGFPTADLYMLREADRHDRQHDVSNAMAGCFC